MINEIIDNIYIGSWSDAHKYNNEFEVFTVAWDSPYKSPNHFYKIIDGGNDPLPETRELYFNAVKDLITTRERSDKNRKILVHCMSGMSRAPSVVAAYIIYKYNLNTTNSLQYIKNIRPIINPANSFIKLLNEFEIKKQTQTIFI